ncbi:DMT family transporter [Microbacterium sediminicola]|uniref:DMT family transporter n=1 Tax=Microbacterium sediminicola TaxID=415210 RepID=UPI0031E037CA
MPVVFGALALVWGASFLFMKLAVIGLSPAQVALGRIILGALTLAAIMAFTRRHWPRERALWLHMVVVAIFFCVAPFLLFAWAAEQLPSGLSAILNATTPLWTTLVAVVALRGERMTLWRAVGVLIGAVGVAVVIGIGDVLTSAEFAASLPAQLACLGATASYGIALGWMRRFVTGRYRHDPVTLAATQMAVAGVIALLLVPFIALTPVAPDVASVLSLLALGCLGTGVVYVWNMRVIAAWGAVGASTVTYVIPVVGVALGILVLGESFALHELVGALIVVGGVVLVQWKR